MGRGEGGGGAAPVGATLFTPFLINQSWVHHSPALCWCWSWVLPARVLGTELGGGQLCFLSTSWAACPCPSEENQEIAPSLHVSTALSHPVHSSVFRGKQSPDTLPLQVWLLNVIDTALASRGHSSARSPVGSGRADTGLTPVAVNMPVGVPQAHVSAAGAWVGSCCSVLPGHTEDVARAVGHFWEI